MSDDSDLLIPIAVLAYFVCILIFAVVMWVTK